VILFRADGRDVAQPGSAHAWGACGRWFKSTRPDHFHLSFRSSAVSLILLTNDDGIEAEGLRCLESALSDYADILVVAPDRERSAVSHGITIHAPLELNKVGAGRYSLNGTPADCVIYTLEHLSPRPDLVISGINHGANLGDDIMYSGTVAGAREASRHGVASIAVSQAYDEKPIKFEAGAKFMRQLVEELFKRGLQPGICLNINIPVRRIKGLKITRQGCTSHFPHFNMLGEHTGEAEDDSQSKNSAFPRDFEVVVDHYVSVTPLQRDQTDYGAAQVMTRDGLRLLRTFHIPGLS
jgi:5'-nucleotidase